MPEQPPKRIVFIGAECTGKTTLTKAVAEYFGEPYSSEYVRHHVDQLNRPLDESDLDPIAKGQIRFEDEAAALAKTWVFHDTNLLSSILYAEYYFDTHLSWVDEIFAERNYAHYFLCEPDIPWEADEGQREGPEVRSKLQAEFVSILQRHNIAFTRLNGSLEKRRKLVITSLQSPLDSDPHGAFRCDGTKSIG